MALDTTEHEQVETLKRFWRENGKGILGGVLVGIALLFAFQAWQQGKHSKAEAASAEYFVMMDSVAQGDWKSAEEHGSRIVGQYADTAYAAMAALAMAKAKLEQNDSVSARAHLQWVIEKASMPEIEGIARLRLAMLQLGEGEAEQALKTVQSMKGEQFSSVKNELLGDIYLALDESDKARAAYDDALESLKNEGGKRVSFLQMKLDNIDVK
jgi:predicted negative regulator of RcsB-dependent stress response